jgi:hypothetical protein
MCTIITTRRARKARASAFSLFDEAVHLIHQRWENRDGFATAIAETLKALLGARTAFVGFTDIRTGTWEPLFNNLFAELDPTSARFMRKSVGRISAAFADAGEEHPTSHSSQVWGDGNPYSTLSKSFTQGEYQSARRREYQAQDQT